MPPPILAGAHHSASLPAAGDGRVASPGGRSGLRPRSRGAITAGGTPPPRRSDHAVVDALSRERTSSGGGLATVFVHDLGGRTCTVPVELRGTVPELEAAVRRKLPDFRADEQLRLCAVGGAPLAQRAGLTLAECGVRANSSLQVLGRLLGGGAEVRLGDRTFEVSEEGALDLGSQDLGPDEVAELARWLATPASAAVASLKLGRTNVGTIYVHVHGRSAFQVNSSGGGGVALRNSPDMDDRWVGGLGPADGEMVFASEHTDAWIRVANMGKDKWLPKKFLVEVDTTKPCTFQVLCNALKTSKVTEVDFSSCGLESPAMEILSDYIRDATAGVARLSLGSNPQIGDEAMVQLLEVLKDVSLTSLDISKTGCAVSTTGKLAELLSRATKFSAALNELSIAFNPIGTDGGVALRDALKTSNLKFLTIGKMYTSKDGSAITGSQLTTGVTLSAGGRLGELVQFHSSGSHVKLKWADDGRESDWMSFPQSLDGEALKLPLQSPFEGELLDLAHQKLDPGLVVILSWWLTTEFSAAVAQVVLSGNAITDYDRDISGLTAFCEALPSAKNLTSIDFSKCGIKVKGVNEIAKAMSAGAGSVEVIKLDGNPIGYPSKVNLKPGAKAGVAVKKGVFAAVDERFGEVTQDPNRRQEVKLRWLDDGSEGKFDGRSYIKVDKLTSVVASRADLIDEHSHIQALGEAISGSKVKQISLAQCRFNSATLTTFVQSVRWDTAVVADLNISMNPIGVDGAKALADVISGSSLKCLIIGPKGTRLPVNNDDVTELNFEGQEFGPAEVTLVAAATSTLAALNSLTVDSTGNMKSQKTYTLTAGEDQIQLSKKNLGSADVALIAAWLQRPEVSAALNSLTIDSTGVPAQYDGYGGLVDGTGPKTYTLTAGEDQIELSQKNLGSADVALLTAWLQRPEVIAGVASLDISSEFCPC
eukprot:COSAG06_NODE_621_length_13727_cov_26.487893_2_plen_935_part_00